MNRSPLLLSILAALSACHATESGEACMGVDPAATSCPSEDSVEPADLSAREGCGYDVEEVTGPGKRTRSLGQDGMWYEQCCYPAELYKGRACVVGRPYLDGRDALLAPLITADGAAVSGSARAVAWARAGAGEHASVAAFGRLALSLLRLGAPLDLLRDVHQAALDEIAHTELCFGLAERYGAPRLGAGDFPLPQSVALDADLVALAEAAVREGCLAETLGAHVVAVAAELAGAPEVRAALSRIAEEEARHAVLSFRLVAWAIRAGGNDVRDAVRAAFAAPWPLLDVEELAMRAGVDVERLRAAAETGAREILHPAAAALLAA